MTKLALLLAAIFVVAAPPVRADAPKSGTFPCYWTYGRLATYNGGPPVYRIWPTGTHRLLGVYGRNKNGALEPDILPAGVKQLNPHFDVDIWGNYKVCPIVEERKGWMRMVEIRDTRGLKAVKR